MRTLPIPLNRDLFKKIPAIMVKYNMLSIPDYKIPDGFSIRHFKKGEESAWADLEYLNSEFDTKEQALAHFYKEFGSDTRIIEKYCIFMLNKKNEVVGTSIAWQDYDFQGVLYGRLHWVSIHPDFQDRGLSKPLISLTLKKLAEYHNKVYLTTLPTNFIAIKIYIGFGFMPFIFSSNYQILWEALSSVNIHTDLQILVSKLSDIYRNYYPVDLKLKNILLI